METLRLEDELLDTLTKKQEALFNQKAIKLYIHPKVSSFIGAPAERATISCQQKEELLKNLAEDRTERMTYFNLGDQSILRSNEPLGQHSCLTWCEKHLQKININLSEQQSWL